MLSQMQDLPNLGNNATFNNETPWKQLQLILQAECNTLKQSSRGKWPTIIQVHWGKWRQLNQIHLSKGIKHIQWAANEQVIKALCSNWQIMDQTKAASRSRQSEFCQLSWLIDSKPTRPGDYGTVPGIIKSIRPISMATVHNSRFYDSHHRNPGSQDAILHCFDGNKLSEDLPFM